MAYTPYNKRSSKPLEPASSEDLGLESSNPAPPFSQAEEAPEPILEPEQEKPSKPINTSSFYSEKYKTVNYLNSIKKDLPPQEKATKINNMEKEIYFAQQRILEGENLLNNSQATFYGSTDSPAYPPVRSSKRKKRKKHKLLLLVTAGIGIGLLTILALTLAYSLYCFYFVQDGNFGVVIPVLIYSLGIASGCGFVSNIVRQRSLLPAIIVASCFFILSIALSLIYASIADFKVSYILLKLFFTFVASILGFLLSSTPNLIINKRYQRKRRQTRLKNS